MARKAINAEARSASVETKTEQNQDEKQHVVGRGWHGNSEGHAAAGRKGGAKVAEDREHMAEIGRKGGAKVAQNREHMAEIGRRGGSKVSENREHMATIGRRGGSSK